MRDLLSDLPAPLPLMILLQLPDLKALCAAILASPNLYAAFHHNAHQVFLAMANRNVRPRTLMPIVVYIRLMCKHSQNIYTAALAGANWNKSDETTSELEDIHHITRDNMPVAVIFHVVAQAVRIHDRAYYILRSKLDYLAKLQFEQLADPGHQWADMQDWAMREHEGKPMSVPTRLQDPSWVEENRVMDHLWTLVACTRAARMLTHRTGEVVRLTLTEVQQVLSDLRETARSAEETDEIITSISHGPVLEAPSRTGRASPPNAFDHAVLQTYPIQHPPYSNPAPTQNVGISGTCPEFSQSPAPYTSIDEFMVWDRHSKALTRSNNMTGFVRHPCVCNHVHDHNTRGCRLELYFLDRWRTSVELRLRRPPEFPHRIWQEIVE